MNREIEFRAWLKDEKKMVEVTRLGLFDKQIEKRWVIYKVKPFEQSLKYLKDIELMQYTGLKDKNGVKIFEGDIVKLDEDDICFIEWDEYDYSYRIKNKEVDDMLCGFRPKDFEVIGNIYENPELLEVSDEIQSNV